MQKVGYRDKSGPLILCSQLVSTSLILGFLSQPIHFTCWLQTHCFYISTPLLSANLISALINPSFICFNNIIFCRKSLNLFIFIPIIFRPFKYFFWLNHLLRTNEPKLRSPACPKYILVVNRCLAGIAAQTVQTLQSRCCY